LELNLFGSGRVPNEDFRTDLASLARLSNKNLTVLQRWFSESREFGTMDWQDYQEAFRRTDLTIEAFEGHVSLVQLVLNRWQAEKLGLAEVAADFGKLGLSPAAVRKLTKFFATLEKAGERVYLASIRNFHETAALPTIDDVNIICELRPLFGDPAYEGRPMGRDYDKLLGFAELVLLEIVGSGPGDDLVRSTYQLAERDLDLLLEGLNRAKRQLEIMKAWKNKAEKSTVARKEDRSDG
jgi:hypothetical protein